MSGPTFKAGGNIEGAFATGPRATATAMINKTVAPDPTVDIVAALAALQGTLASLPGVEPKALTRIEEARTEAAKPEPKREEVKSLVAQATQYAKDAAGFAEAADKLEPPLRQVAAWVGSTWQAWAPTLGLG